MPKKVIKKIEEEYEEKGKSPKKAKAIAYATLNKEGLLEKKAKKRAKKPIAKLKKARKKS